MSEHLKYDSPVEKIEDDALERKTFSENLAKSIIGLKSSQGFVYGLYGAWGVGKTTVLNFTEYYIEEHNKKPESEGKIVIFKFNPWMFSGAENLVRLFLEQLRIRLNMEDVSEKLKKVSKTLGYLEHGLSLAEVVIPYAGKAKKVVSNLKKTSDTLIKDTQKDLHHIKKDIISALQNQPDKILVIIDDLDRLFENEIKDFIKMIKAVCDFPKIIYLLACDSEKIAKALKINKNDDGYDYLEKIVQCSFNIPRPPKDNLHQLFIEDLNKILEPTKNQDVLFDETEWGNLFHEGISPCLRTPRNVKTLINSIVVCYPAVCNEVNITDFVGIQTIRVFYPKAYALIECNKDFFVSSFYNNESYKEKIKIFYNTLDESVSSNQLQNFQSLMSRLFPNYSHIVKNSGIYQLSYLKKHRKVCSEECFDRYFRLDLPKDWFSLEDMQAIIALIDNPAQLKEKLLSFIEKGKSENKQIYRRFLNELQDFTEKSIPENKIQPFLQVMYDISDEVPFDEAETFLDFNIRMRMLHISYQLRTRFKEEEKRFQILREIFENSQSVSMVVLETSAISSALKEHKENRVNSEHLQELIVLALKKIKQFSDKIHTLENFSYILYRWKDWGVEREVKEYVMELIQTDAGLLDLLTGFMSMSISYGMSDAVSRKNYRVSHENLLKFIDDSDLQTSIIRVREMDLETLNQRQRKAVDVFLKEADNPERYLPD